MQYCIVLNNKYWSLSALEMFLKVVSRGSGNRWKNMNVWQRGKRN
jgi:hypothetical protein